MIEDIEDLSLDGPLTTEERILRVKTKGDIKSILELSKYVSRDIIINLTLRSTSYRIFYQNQQLYNELNVTIEEVIDFLKHVLQRFKDDDMCIDISYDIIDSTIDYYCYILTKDVNNMISSEINDFINKRYQLLDSCIDLLIYNEIDNRVFNKLLKLTIQSPNLLFKILLNIRTDLFTEGLAILIDQCCKISITRLLDINNVPMPYVVSVLSNRGYSNLSEYESSIIISYYMLRCNRKDYTFLELDQVIILLHNYLIDNPIMLVSIRRNKLLEIIENGLLSCDLQKKLLLNIPKNEISDILIASPNWYMNFDHYEILELLLDAPRSQLYRIIELTINKLDEKDIMIIIEYIKRIPRKYILSFYNLIKATFPNLLTNSKLIEIKDREYKRYRRLNKKIKKLCKDSIVNQMSLPDIGKKQHIK